jgi:NAD(P)-dependent dehydrogenase (short-subunit alcohol dehydrogenase family)
MQLYRQSTAQASARSLERLREARVLVTGGTSGLGLALVRARTAAHVERVGRDFPGTVAIVGDIAEKHDIHRVALQALGTLGGLDVLINNASALGPTPLRLLADTDCETLEHVFATNVLGPFRLTKAVLGALATSAREHGSAVVLNISSDAAVNAYARWGAYSTSKAALAHLTRIWNEELASEGIRALAIDPGDMDTPLHSAALPDADRRGLKRPEVAARELIATVLDLLELRSERNPWRSAS